MKKFIKTLLLISVILMICSCGKKTKGFSDEELEEIHAKEASLKKQLVNRTWHFYDEPARAVRYLEDGSYENYHGAGIRGVDYFSGDDGTWDIMYCGSLDADTKYLEEDKERALKYYDYNVVVRYVNRDGENKSYTETIEFDENGDLIISGDRAYDGPSIIEHMPEGLGIHQDLPGHIWYIDGFNCYALFFKDGYCYMTHGVFADGTTNASYIYRWGYDESAGVLYLTSHYQPEEEILEDVEPYYLNGAAPAFQLAELWSDSTNVFDMNNVDGEDDSALALMNSYNNLNRWTVELWEQN